MAISVAAFDSKTGASTNSIVIDKPSGVVSGSPLLVLLANDNGGGTDQFTPGNAPTGFTFVTEFGDSSSDVHVGLYTRTADGTEAATLTCNSVGSDDFIGFYLRLDGADENYSLDAIGIEYISPSAATTHDITGVTSLQADSLAILFAGSSDGDATGSSVNNGFTIPTNGEVDTGTGSTSLNGLIATKALATSSLASGTTTVTHGSSTSTTLAGFQILLTSTVVPASNPTIPAVISTKIGLTDSGTSVEVQRPRGMEDGDILLIAVGNDDNTNTAQWSAAVEPDGFTFVREMGDSTSDVHMALFEKEVDGSEPFYITVDSLAAGDRDNLAYAHHIKGGDESTLIAILGTNYVSTSNSLTHTVTEVTSIEDDALAITYAYSDGGDTQPFTFSAGWTIEEQDTTGGAGSNLAGAFASKEMATAGATGDNVVTFNAGSDGMVGIQIIINPGAAPPVGGFFGNTYYEQLKVGKMAITKNVASQKWMVFAFDTTDGTAKTGDAANISANIRKDWGSAAVTNDVAPTELEDGYYAFDLTQTETDADVLALFPASSTSNIQVIGMPAVQLTAPASFPDDIIQTGDSFARLGAPAGASVSADIADVPTVSEFNARTLLSASYFDPTADAVANVTLCGTVTTNTDMRGTDNAFLATSAPANFGSLVITGAGAVDSLLQGYLNTLIAETTAGNISANFDTFYDNADAITAKVVDDVGAGSGGGTDWSASERNEIRGRLGVTGTTAAGGNTPTLALESSLFDPATDQVDADIVAISGDATAADNLELMYNGTGYVDDTAPSSRAQVDSIGAASGGSLAFENDQDNIGGAIQGATFVGVETSGTNVSVNFEDGVYHVIDDTGNDIDIVYEFDVGGGRTAVEMDWLGFVNGSNDQLEIQAWNGSTWDVIAIISGKAGSSNDTISRALFNSHTGTGADLGKVYIRLQGLAQTNPTLNTDQLVVKAVNIGQSIGYANGAIWVDTINGTAGAEVFVNGVGDNPVLTWADALTLSASLGIESFQIIGGSTITLSANSDNHVLKGSNWTLALGGQSIVNAYFQGATGVSGVSTGAGSKFEDCRFNDFSTDSIWSVGCRLGGTFTPITNSVGYFFQSCFSSTGTVAVVDLSSRTNVVICLTPLTGGINIINSTSAGNLVHIEGGGEINIAASSTAGNLEIGGDFTLLDSGAMTVRTDDKDTNIKAVLVDTGTTLPAQISALNDISVSDLLTTQMTEAYAADGVAPTLAQAILLIQQTIGDFAISGTTITAKKIDGSTTAATYTLDDGTSPTSRTRAS